jgi:hypothetical protein
MAEDPLLTADEPAFDEPAEDLTADEAREVIADLQRIVAPTGIQETYQHSSSSSRSRRTPVTSR